VDLVDHPVWVEIDVDAIKHNVAALKSHVGDGTAVLGVVKANGYGHGDVDVAPAVVEGGADWLGVARVAEGESLRRAGIEVPILILSEPPPSSVGRGLKAGLTQTVYTPEAIDHLDAVATKDVDVHLKVDTGMHRYGVAPEGVPALIRQIDESHNLRLTGLWTHLAVAEETTNPFTKQQYERFMDVVESLGQRADDLVKHISNSAATMSFKPGHLDMVRCGIAIYGIPPSRELSEAVDLRPALSLKSQVGAVKRLNAGESLSYGLHYTLPADANVATIAAGYADGLTRALTGRSSVLIRGKEYRIAGSVTMDHFLIDAGDDLLEPGDEVVIIGSQGDKKVTAHDVADVLGTIPYEVVCAIGARVPRIHLNS
jgi:alanine racemase